jgi:hypothetical protein
MDETVTQCESNLQVLLTNNSCDLWLSVADLVI